MRAYITTGEARNAIAPALRNVVNRWIVLCPRAVEGLGDEAMPARPHQPNAEVFRLPAPARVAALLTGLAGASAGS